MGARRGTPRDTLTQRPTALERGGKYAAAWEAMHRSAGHARTNRRDPTGDR